MSANTARQIAITGATGFVGAAIAERALVMGQRVRLLVRAPERLPTELKASTGSEISVVKGDLADSAAVAEFVTDADILIHCAGLTHARRRLDFFEVNVDGAKHLARGFSSVTKSDSCKLFVHISSLAARQPHLSAYAQSKRDSEDVIAANLSTENYIILRAPALYGQRDMATLPFFKSVKQGVAPIPGGKEPKRASILYVEDFVDAVMASLEGVPRGETYEVGDQQPDGHSWSEIAAACAKAQSAKARALAVPRPVLHGWAAISSAIMRLRGKAPMVTTEKIAEFFHPDWAARDNLLADFSDWQPKHSLNDGFELATRWYRDQGLL